MAGKPVSRRLLAGAVSLLVAVGVASVPAGPAAAATLAVVPGAAEAVAAASARTVRIDPSYQQQPFEGWGTSLVWFANITGGYPDEIRDKLVDMLFSEDGLDLNIARYNIGGGNAPDVRADYMKVGATMEGFWKAPAGTTHADMDWWDPANPEHWNWDADANQRWWLEQIKDRVDLLEAFSNSPPWFQTVSGYVSGGFNSSADQIRADRVDEFATYLVRVVEHLEQQYGIQFDTIDPLNEPNTPYWGTTLGPDGQPTGGRQEGAHAGPALQEQVVLALRRALDSSATGAVVSAMDETNPGTFTQNWNAYGAPARAAVDQLNVHTYGTGMRTSARDIAKGANRRLWMSEVEGSFASPTSYTSMEPGLGIANRIVSDLRELEPSAWVLWQPIEDAIPQVAGGGNWGSIHIPFNCTADATLQTCPIQTNTKFNTIRNFTHYIRPGDQLVRVDDPSTTAAISSSGQGVTAVHVNDGTTERAVTLDLSLFGTVASGATVTPVVSSAAGALVRGEPVRVSGRSATLVVPAKSVTTFLIDGAQGIAGDAALVRSGHTYRLRGVQSGRSLAPSADGSGTVIRTTDPAAAEQLWSVRQLTRGVSNRERYAVFNEVNGRQLAVRDNAAVLEEASGTTVVEPGAQWLMSTTGDGNFTLVNAATGRLLDVAGQSTVDGATVGTWTATSGSNQLWTVIDETVLGTEPVRTYTLPGLAPTLPSTVTGVYRDGARGSLPVTWTEPAAWRWRHPGTVRVRGTATDPLGHRIPATAVVTVDTFSATLPARAKTYVGGQPVLPGTVTGVGDHGGTAVLPVTWQPAPAGAFDAAGVAVLPGQATIVDGTTVGASVRVQVTEPAQANTALEDGVAVGATFTENGYSPAGLRNGNLTEKAWSNWKPGDTKNPSDTITVTLPAARDLTRVVTHFYRDGSNPSFPASLRVQVLAADGNWADASGEVPVTMEGSSIVEVPVPAVSTTSVRVVMTARPGGYMTVSEIEVFAKAPGVSSVGTAASIEVDGVPVTGFDPAVTSYRVVARHPRGAAVTVTPADPYAAVAVSRSRHGDLVKITVTSEDGSQTTVYRLRLVRR